jgi:hypothetical protein
MDLGARIRTLEASKGAIAAQLTRATSGQSTASGHSGRGRSYSDASSVGGGDESSGEDDGGGGGGGGGAAGKVLKLRRQRRVLVAEVKRLRHVLSQRTATGAGGREGEGETGRTGGGGGGGGGARGEGGAADEALQLDVAKLMSQRLESLLMENHQLKVRGVYVCTQYVRRSTYHGRYDGWLS